MQRLLIFGLNVEAYLQIPKCGSFDYAVVAGSEKVVVR